MSRFYSSSWSTHLLSWNSLVLSCSHFTSRLSLTSSAHSLRLNRRSSCYIYSQPINLQRCTSPPSSLLLLLLLLPLLSVLPFAILVTRFRQVLRLEMVLSMPPMGSNKSSRMLHFASLDCLTSSLMYIFQWSATPRTRGSIRPYG